MPIPRGSRGSVIYGGYAFHDVSEQSGTAANFPYDGENSGSFEPGPFNRYGSERYATDAELRGRDQETRDMFKGQGRIMTTGDRDTFPGFWG